MATEGNGESEEGSGAGGGGGPDELVTLQSGGEGLLFGVAANDGTHAAEADLSDALAGGQADEVLDGLADLNGFCRIREEDAAGAEIAGLTLMRKAPGTRADEFERESQFESLGSTLL